VQLGTEDGNKAFTDMLWSGGDDNKLESSGNFQYIESVNYGSFGSSLSVDTLNEATEQPAAARANVCSESAYYGVDFTYTADYGFSVQDISYDGLDCADSLFDAQSYRDVTLGILPGEAQEWPPSTVGVAAGGYGSLIQVCDWAEDPSSCESSNYYCGSDDSLCNDSTAVFCTSDAVCEGGLNDGAPCSDSSDCRLVDCVSWTYEGAAVTNNYSTCGYGMDTKVHFFDDHADAAGRLNDLFALSYKLYEYKGHGGSSYYEEYTNNKGNWDWDIADGNGDYTPTPPTIKALGESNNTDFTEGTKDTFSLNYQSSTDVYGAGTKNVVASFFVYAYKEQMPLRILMIDWGDGSDLSDGDEWAQAQYGSTQPDNYYKNYRGVNSSGGTFCTPESGGHFGTSSDGCTTGYASFENDYTCSTGYYDELEDGRACIVDDNGNLTNSPCQGGDSGAPDGYCVFQPRVFAQDNWGWCASSNPVCDAGSDANDEACYGDGDKDECNYEDCPGSDCLETFYGGTVDPWVYYDGFVMVEAQ